MMFPARCLVRLRRRLERERQRRFYRRADLVVERLFADEARKLLLQPPPGDAEWRW